MGRRVDEWEGGWVGGEIGCQVSGIGYQVSGIGCQVLGIGQSQVCPQPPVPDT
jgi:hypothetical protein